MIEDEERCVQICEFSRPNEQHCFEVFGLCSKSTVGSHREENYSNQFEIE
jgi:hypothetical protein